MTRCLMFGFLLAPSLASAGELSIGVGVGAALDLPDRVNIGGDTKLGVGPGLYIPVRYAFGESVAFRATVRVDSSYGTGSVSWKEGDRRAYSDEPWTMYLGPAVTAGFDIAPPGTSFKPYFGAEAGVAFVNTIQSYGESTGTQQLFDAEQEDLENSNYIDGMSTQPAVMSDLHIGLRGPLSDGVDLWVETGYSLAFVDSAKVKRTPASLDVMHDPYGYNAVRLGVGVAFSF